MRPLTSSGLKRRMNELERALSTTVVILLVLLFFTSFWIHENDIHQPNILKMKSLGAISSSNLGSVNMDGYPGEREGPSFAVEKDNFGNIFVTDPDYLTRKEIINEITKEEQQNQPGTSPPASTSSFPKPGEYFLPGALNLSRTDVIHKCYLPSDMKLPNGQGCSISRKYKILFHLTPKSGSSTGRHVIKNDFEGVDYSSDQMCKIKDEKERPNWIEVAVLRNPATRAFASYEEMFVRRLGNPEHIPQNCRGFMEQYKGWIYTNYSALFDTSEGVKRLTRSYEQFMRDWDGQAFDMHLDSQIAYNVKRQGINRRPTARHLDFVFDTHTMENSFEIIAKKVGLKKRPRVIKGRAYPRRMKVSDVSDEAFQAMCRRYRHDFCCLNYPLPKQCLQNVPAGQAVQCKWVEVDSELLIDAVVV